MPLLEGTIATTARRYDDHEIKNPANQAFDFSD